MAPQSRQRSAAQNIGVLMLLYHLKQFGFNRIPPVTLMTIVGMSMIFTGMLQVSWTKEEACVSSNKVLKAREFRRVFLSAIEHGDDMHLFYNMISYLVKGVSLERKLGSVYFAYLIFVFCNACSLVYILLANGMAQLFNEPFFLDQCAIGFSAVLFALKVLVASYSVSTLVHLMPGVVVPSTWAYWLELVLIQIMVPNASFIGHLAGILVGVLFVKGPLKLLMDLPYILLTGRMTPDPRIEMHEDMEEMDVLMPDEGKRRREYRHRLEKEIQDRQRFHVVSSSIFSHDDEDAAAAHNAAIRGSSSSSSSRLRSNYPLAPPSSAGLVQAGGWFSGPSYTYRSGVSGFREREQGSNGQDEDQDLNEALRRSRQAFFKPWGSVGVGLGAMKRRRSSLSSSGGIDRRGSPVRIIRRFSSSSFRPRRSS